MRLQRSFLAVPGSRPDFFEKALRGEADAVFLDLEDGVAPEDKPAARRDVIQGLHDLDWRGAGKTITLRINVLGGPYAHRDLVEVVEPAVDRIDTVLMPKVDAPGDVHAVDLLLTGIEAAAGAERRIGIEALIESAPGLAAVDAIARSSPRLEALHVGPGDLAASLGSRTTGIGGLSPDYPGDQWHAALTWILVACPRQRPARDRRHLRRLRRPRGLPGLGPPVGGAGLRGQVDASTPRRSRRRTRSTRRPRTRSRRPAGSSPRWRRPSPPAAARSGTRGA